MRKNGRERERKEGRDLGERRGTTVMVRGVMLRKSHTYSLFSKGKREKETVRRNNKH